MNLSNIHDGDNMKIINDENIIITNTTQNDDILHDIYYNTGEPFKDKSTNHIENIWGIRSRVIDYNKKHNKLYEPNSILTKCKDMKKYKNKLYSEEYTRTGEKDYNFDYCLNSKSIDKIKDIGFNKNKEGEYSLLTYNIHAFIKQCSYINQKEDLSINSRNNKEIIEFINLLSPDIVFFQEYSPYYIEDNIELKLSNFFLEYNKKFTDNKYEHFTTSNCSSPQSNSDYLGNFIMSKHNLNNILLYKYRSNRCFIESKIQINDIDIIVLNIHPQSESRRNNYNKEQIIHFFNLISNKYNVNEVPIIIAGDFNTDNKDIHDNINNMGFISVHNIYNNLDNNIYSGYHGVLIDYIYISRKFTNIFKISDFKIFNLDSSDHYPLLFKFKIKEDYLIKDLELNFSLQRQNCYHLMSNYINISEIRKFIIDLKMFMKVCNYENIVYIPKDIYLAHGTNKINFNDTNIPYEIDNKSYLAKSFTLLNNPGESFMSWYGINDEASLKRLLIYKVKRKIPILNLVNTEKTLSDRLNKRFTFYQKLWTFYFERFSKSFKSLEDISPEGGYRNFRIMFILQLLLNNTLFNHINEENNLYNNELFYGTIVSDIIQNDFTFEKKNTYIKQNYTDVHESYEGTEIQLFATSFFVDLVGVYYNNTFYTLDEWKHNSEAFVITVKNNKKIYPKELNFRIKDHFPTNIEKYNIIINSLIMYQHFITKLLLNQTYYSEVNNTNYNNMYLNIININSWLNIDKDNIIFNNLVNDFIVNLLNVNVVYNNFNKLDNIHIKNDSKIDFDTFSIRQNNIFYTNMLDQYNLYIQNLYTLSTNNLVKFFYLIILLSFKLFKQSKTAKEPLLIIIDYIIDKDFSDDFITDDNFKKFIQKYVENYTKHKSNDNIHKKYLKYKKKYLKLKNIL